MMLAKCCLADLTIRMFDAQAIGDIESENCLLEKSLALKGAISALCQWWEPEVLTATYETNFTPSGGRIIVNTWTFAGETVLPHGETISTPVGQGVVDAVNAVSRDGSVKTGASLVSDNRVLVQYTYPNSSRGSEPTITLSTGSSVSEEESAEETVDADNAPCLDDDQLEGIFNIIDRVCGCNCPDGHSADTVGEFL